MATPRFRMLASLVFVLALNSTAALADTPTCMVGRFRNEGFMGVNTFTDVLVMMEFDGKQQTLQRVGSISKAVSIISGLVSSEVCATDPDRFVCSLGKSGDFYEATGIFVQDLNSFFKRKKEIDASENATEAAEKVNALVAAGLCHKP